MTELLCRLRLVLRLGSLAPLLVLVACQTSSASPPGNQSQRTESSSASAPANPASHAEVLGGRGTVAGPRAKGAGVLTPALREYLPGVLSQIDSVPSERRRQLKKLALFVETKLASGEDANLVFICTHNSRRSHMSQLWAATAAA